jgi:hypothetical protein
VELAAVEGGTQFGAEPGLLVAAPVQVGGVPAVPAAVGLAAYMATSARRSTSTGSVPSAMPMLAPTSRSWPPTRIGWWMAARSRTANSSPMSWGSMTANSSPPIRAATAPAGSPAAIR